YHRRCTEAWCINEDVRPTPPFDYPRIPIPQLLQPEIRKRLYLEGLGGRSYQANLLSLDQKAGLRFEFNRFTSWTIAAMTGWVKHPGAVREMKLEDFAADFDGAM